MPEPADQRKACAPEAERLDPTAGQPPAGAWGIAAGQVPQAENAGAGGPAKGLRAGGRAAGSDDERAVGAGTGGGAVRAARQVAQADHAGAGGPAKGLVVAGRADVILIPAAAYDDGA